MNTQQAQSIILNYIECWCNDIAPDFIEDSINGGDEDEVIQAYKQVGLNFEWTIKAEAN